jgi:hypothetical protein
MFGVVLLRLIQFIDGVKIRVVHVILLFFLVLPKFSLKALIRTEILKCHRINVCLKNLP